MEDANQNIGARNYQRLLISVAQAESLEEGKFLSEQRFEKEGVSLCFEHLQQTNLCRIGFPLEPAPKDIETFKAMLESNAIPENGFLPIMALEPESGQCMMFVHFPAIEDAELALLGFLNFGVLMVRDQWKEFWADELNQAPPAISILA